MMKKILPVLVAFLLLSLSVMAVQDKFIILKRDTVSVINWTNVSMASNVSAYGDLHYLMLNGGNRPTANINWGGKNLKNVSVINTTRLSIGDVGSIYKDTSMLNIEPKTGVFLGRTYMQNALSIGENYLYVGIADNAARLWYDDSGYEVPYPQLVWETVDTIKGGIAFKTNKSIRLNFDSDSPYDALKVINEFGKSTANISASGDGRFKGLVYSYGGFFENGIRVCLANGTNCLPSTLLNWSNITDNYWNKSQSDGRFMYKNGTQSITYNATSVATVHGTLTSGDLTSLKYADDHNSYNVSEVTGANPLDVVINFTGVTNFNTILLNMYYRGSAGHHIQFGLYDFTTNSYEYEYGNTVGMSGFAFININVYDQASHIQAGTNKVSLILHHVENGQSSHRLYIDYAHLIQGFSTITNQNHDSLTGRDSETNHPWAAPRNTTLRNATNANLKNLNLTQRLYILNSSIYEITGGIYGSNGLYFKSPQDLFFYAANGAGFMNLVGTLNIDDGYTMGFGGLGSFRPKVRLGVTNSVLTLKQDLGYVGINPAERMDINGLALNVSTAFYTSPTSTGIRTTTFDTVGTTQLAVNAPTYMNGSLSVMKRDSFSTEKALNGNFASSANWTFNTGWLYDSAGGRTQANKSNAGTGNLVHTFKPEMNAYYKVTYSVTYRTAGNVKFTIGGCTGAQRTTATTYTEYCYTTNTAPLTFIPSGTAARFGIDTVSVTRVQGGNVTIGRNANIGGTLTLNGNFTIYDTSTLAWKCCGTSGTAIYCRIGEC